MTLSEFLAKLLQQFPRAQYWLRIEATCRRTPPFQRTLFGEATKHPEATEQSAQYRLTITPDYFSKEGKKEEDFEAPSLLALWTTLQATYHLDGLTPVVELESWLKAQ